MNFFRNNFRFLFITDPKSLFNFQKLKTNTENLILMTCCTDQLRIVR